MYEEIIVGQSVLSSQRATVPKSNIIFDRVQLAIAQGVGTSLAVTDLEKIWIRASLNGERYKDLELFNGTFGEFAAFTDVRGGQGATGIAASTTLVAELYVGLYDLTGGTDDLVITVYTDAGMTAATTSPVIDIVTYRGDSESGQYLKYVSKTLKVGGNPITENNVIMAFTYSPTSKHQSTDQLRLIYGKNGSKQFAEKYASRSTTANAKVETITGLLNMIFQDDDFTGTKISFESLTADKRLFLVQSLS